MSLEARIEHDAQEAMRGGDAVALRTLRMVRAALKNAAIDARGALDDDAVQRVLQQQAKMRRDAIDQFAAAGRAELAAAEEAELAVIARYLPEQLDAAAVEQVARDVLARISAGGPLGPGDVGRLMGPVMAELKGRADGRVVNEVVRRLLAG